MAHRTNNAKEPGIVIIGGGFAGLTLACLLGKAGIRVSCVDPGIKIPENLRTTAISYGSRLILEEAGIWKFLEDKACPIERIEVLEESSPVLLDFLTDEHEGKTFGWIVLNSDMRAAMMQAFEKHKTLKFIAPASAKDFKVTNDSACAILDDGAELKADLIVGADGRNSFVREWMNVRTREWDYRQRAILCVIEHENAHHNTAIEHFFEQGPFAMLPMQGNRSAVVFTEHGPQSQSSMKLSNEDFQTAIAARVPEKYGAIKIVNKPMSYSLGYTHANSYIGPRMALIADAAHAIHPVAGQGLNLGFRDVKALAGLLIKAHEEGEDLGSEELLADYQRARRFDNVSMAAVTDGLVRLFGSGTPPIRFLRRAGLKLVSKMPAARKFILKASMGDRH